LLVLGLEALLRKEFCDVVVLYPAPNGPAQPFWVSLGYALPARSNLPEAELVPCQDGGPLVPEFGHHTRKALPKLEKRIDTIENSSQCPRLRTRCADREGQSPGPAHFRPTRLRSSPISASRLEGPPLAKAWMRHQNERLAAWEKMHTPTSQQPTSVGSLAGRQSPAPSFSVWDTSVSVGGAGPHEVVDLSGADGRADGRAVATSEPGSPNRMKPPTQPLADRGCPGPLEPSMSVPHQNFNVPGPLAQGWARPPMMDVSSTSEYHDKCRPPAVKRQRLSLGGQSCDSNSSMGSSMQQQGAPASMMPPPNGMFGVPQQYPVSQQLYVLQPVGSLYPGVQMPQQSMLISQPVMHHPSGNIPMGPPSMGPPSIQMGKQQQMPLHESPMGGMGRQQQFGREFMQYDATRTSDHHHHNANEGFEEGCSARGPTAHSSPGDGCGVVCVEGDAKRRRSGSSAACGSPFSLDNP